MFEKKNKTIENKQTKNSEWEENKIISPRIRTHSAPIALGRTSQYSRFAGSVDPA